MSGKLVDRLNNVGIIGLITVQQLVFVTIGLVLWVVSGRHASQFITFDIQQAGKGLALGLLFIAIGLSAFKLFPNAMHKLMMDQRKGFSFLKEPLNWWQIVALSIGAGLGEEALFRGGLQTLFSDYLPIWAAILITSALFGVIHLHSRLIVFIITVVGAVFGIIYYATGSLLVVMIAHAVYDIWAMHRLQVEFNKAGVFDSYKRNRTTPA